MLALMALCPPYRLPRECLLEMCFVEQVRTAYSQVWNHLNGGLPDLEEIVQTNADLSVSA